MALDLFSVLAKIERAHEHGQTVKDEIKAWKNSNPYLVTRNVNADSTRYSLIAHVGVEPTLHRWSLIIGDAMHNLRSALDHLVYAIAVHESGKNPPPNERKLAFPICDTEPRFREQETKRLSDLSIPVRAAIERAQPYHRTNPLIPPHLTIIRDIDDTNKHRLLQLAFSTVLQGHIGIMGPEVVPCNHPDFVLNYGEIKNGTEIAAYAFKRPTPDMEFKDVNLLLVVALWHGKRDQSGPAGSDRSDFPSLFTRLIKEVRDVISFVVRAVS